MLTFYSNVSQNFLGLQALKSVYLRLVGGALKRCYIILGGLSGWLAVKNKNMKIKRKKGFFSISAVAKMFSVHQQTIRLYEKEGLITPKRSEGNTRLFSEEDIEKLEEIIYLTHQLGINLAGVQMILKLKKQIKKMQSHMNDLFDDAQEQLEKESKATEQAIKASAKQLMKIKHEARPVLEDKQDTDEHVVAVDNWEIEYEE